MGWNLIDRVTPGVASTCLGKFWTCLTAVSKLSENFPETKSETYLRSVGQVCDKSETFGDLSKFRGSCGRLTWVCVMECGHYLASWSDHDCKLRQSTNFKYCSQSTSTKQLRSCMTQWGLLLLYICLQMWAYIAVWRQTTTIVWCLRWCCRAAPYQVTSGRCRICKSSVHQRGSHYCQGCAYKKG